MHDGDASAPVLLDRYTCYNGVAPNCDGKAIATPISETIVISSLNGGPQSIVTNLYDAYSSLTSSSVQDYGGTALESQSISYNSQGEPSQIQVLDPASNLVSQTTYGYDQTSVTPTSGIPQHIGGSNSGNQTSSDTWLNTDPSHDFKTSTVYYDTGVPVSSTDPNGATQYSYDSTQTFATQTTPPTPSSGVSLPSYASYDANSGVQLSASDANYAGTAQVQYSQYDNLLRPKQINMIDGGSATYNYSATDTEVSQAMGGGAFADTHTLVDAYGRKSRVAVYNEQSSNGWYQVDYCYNAVGLLQFQSTQYQGNGWATPKQCSGPGTTYTYDALGRVTNVNNADGNVQYSYNRRAVEMTDMNGVQKITQTDALGRVTKICEVSPTKLQGDSPVDCGLDIAGSGYWTSYVYDLANHKVTITQGAQTRIFQTDSLGRTISTQEPESGQTTYSYTYNSTGLQVTRTRPRANQATPSVTTATTTQYDAVGRPITISYNDGTPTKTYVYDVAANWPGFSQGNIKSRLSTTAVSAAGNWVGDAFGYDPMGRLAGLAECLPSGCGNSAYDKHLPYTYDLAGNVTSSGDGAGVTTSYTYSAASEVTSITSSKSGPTYPTSLVSNVQNGINGPIDYSLGNGVNINTTYDALGRLNGRWFCFGGSNQMYCPGGTQVYAFEVSWSGMRATSSSDTALAQGHWYGYDEFNRLNSSTVNNGTVNNFSYTYDRYGNRWAQTVTQGSGPAPSYTFNPANNQIVGYSYDAAGNMTNDGVHNYTYDAEGNITQVDGGAAATYSYNSLNQRVRVDQGSTAKEYVFNAAGQRVSTWDGHSFAQIQGQYYWGGAPIAFYKPNDSLHFQHQDWEGTERVRTSYNGSVEGSYYSLPWGDGFMVNPGGTDADTYHFAQLDHDTESNTEHAQFRNYSTTEGRWLRPDPYSGSYDMGNPQSFNRYVYALNNPLGFVDPSGLDCILENGDVYFDYEYTTSDAAESDCEKLGGAYTAPATYQVSTDPPVDPSPLPNPDPLPNLPDAPLPNPPDSSEYPGGVDGTAPSNPPQVPHTCQQNRILNAVPGSTLTNPDDTVGTSVGGHNQFGINVTTAQLSAAGFTPFNPFGVADGYHNGNVFFQVHDNGQGGLITQGHIDTFNPASGLFGFVGHSIWDVGIGTLLQHLFPHSHGLLDPGC